MTEGSPAARPRSDDRVMAIIGYALLLGGLFSNGISSLVAVVLAYIKRAEAPPLERGHLNYQITTFWIGFIGSLIGLLTMFVPLIAFHIAYPPPPAGATTPPDVPDEFWWIFAAMGAGMLIMFGVFVWTLVRAIYGLVKLTSDKAVGRG